MPCIIRFVEMKRERERAWSRVARASNSSRSRETSPKHV